MRTGVFHCLNRSNETPFSFRADYNDNFFISITYQSLYVQRRGFHAFDTEQLRKAAWHYASDGFFNFK